jgi:hypothetical protein
MNKFITETIGGERMQLGLIQGGANMGKESEAKVIQFRGMELLPQKLAAQYLGISEKTLHNLNSLRKGPTRRKIRGKLFYSRADLDAYQRSQMIVIEGVS